MSLILDALKKAQQETQPTGGKNISLPNPILPPRPPSSKRLLLLVVLLVVSAAAMFYLRYFKAPKTSPNSQPVSVLTATNNSQDSVEIKKKATQLFQENKLSESLALWEQLTLLMSTDPEIYNNLGLVLKKMGKKEAAYSAYNKALALKQDYPEALNNMGVLLLIDNEIGKAKTHFQKALSLTKDYADPYFNMACLSARGTSNRQRNSTVNSLLCRQGPMKN